MKVKGTIGGEDPNPDDEESGELNAVDDQDETFDRLPMQMVNSPAWAQFLWEDGKREHRTSRARDRVLDRRLFKLEKLVARMDGKLGEESPDGNGGTGFIGELRRVGADVESLKNERNFVRGAIAAITAAGTLLVYGFTSWVKNLIPPSHK